MRSAVTLILSIYIGTFLCFVIESGKGKIVLSLAHFKPFDMASFALMTATLVVAGIGVVAGVAAIWGFKEIKDAAIKAAIERAESIAKDTAEVVAARVAMEVRPTTTDAEANQLATVYGEGVQNDSGQ